MVDARALRACDSQLSWRFESSPRHSSQVGQVCVIFAAQNFAFLVSCSFQICNANLKGKTEERSAKSVSGLVVVKFVLMPECGSVGRAPRLGRGGPRSESGHSDRF